jgi:hypothetical protein
MKKATHKLNTGGNVMLYVSLQTGGKAFAWELEYPEIEVTIDNSGNFDFYGSTFNLSEFEEI